MTYQTDVDTALSALESNLIHMNDANDLDVVRKRLRSYAVLIKGMRLDASAHERVKLEFDQHVFRLLVELTGV